MHACVCKCVAGPWESLWVQAIAADVCVYIRLCLCVRSCVCIFLRFCVSATLLWCACFCVRFTCLCVRGVSIFQCFQVTQMSAEHGKYNLGERVVWESFRSRPCITHLNCVLEVLKGLPEEQAASKRREAKQLLIERAKTICALDRFGCLAGECGSAVLVRIVCFVKKKRDGRDSYWGTQVLVRWIGPAALQVSAKVLCCVRSDPAELDDGSFRQSRIDILMRVNVHC